MKGPRTQHGSKDSRVVLSWDPELTFQLSLTTVRKVPGALLDDAAELCRIDPTLVRVFGLLHLLPFPLTSVTTIDNFLTVPVQEPLPTELMVPFTWVDGCG